MPAFLNDDARHRFLSMARIQNTPQINLDNSLTVTKKLPIHAAQQKTGKAARMLSQAEQVVGHRVGEVILRRRTACEELDRTRLNLA